MAISEDSTRIVPPVDTPPVHAGGVGAVNPSALTVEQLARALGLSAETVSRHVEDGAPTGADGTINLVHYAAWLNRRLKERDGD